jgi:hypothetical protein
VPEQILDHDQVSRLLFEPSMRVDQNLIWPLIFQFPSDQGRVESVVWRAKAIEIDTVHNFGCAKQVSDRSRGKLNSTYFGAITGNVGEIRSLRSAGASFTVIHVPSEGDEHAHVGFSPGATKVERNALKVLLGSKFSPVEAHSCS